MAPTDMDKSKVIRKLLEASLYHGLGEDQIGDSAGAVQEEVRCVINGQARP